MSSLRSATALHNLADFTNLAGGFMGRAFGANLVLATIDETKSPKPMTQWVRVALGLMGTWWATHLSAQTPATDWFRPSAPSQVRLSPDGRWAGAIITREAGLAHWVVRDLTSGSDPSLSPSLPPRSVVDDFVWSADGVAVLAGRNADGNAQWWVTRSPQLMLTEIAMPLSTGRSVRLLHPQLPVAGAVLVEAYSDGAGRAWPDVFRLPLDGGSWQLAARNSGDVGEWLADASGRVRLALAIRGVTQELRLAPASPGGTWTPVFRFDFLRDSARLVALSADGQRAWLAARMGRDTRGIYEFDLTAQRFTSARWTDSEFDWDDTLVVHGDELIAVNFQADRPATSWMTELSAGNWKTATVLGQPRSFSADGRRGLFFEMGDRQPGRWWWADHTEQAVRAVLPIADSRLSQGQPMRPITFAARDGVRLRGYLTRTSQVTDAKPPLVVLAHGGPWSRDIWEWRPEVQFLADRGWAVLQVNYRGSAGLGWDFQRLGAGHWDAAANDLADGARWVAEQGWADPDRQVVVGQSFGGFLAAKALTQPSQPFRAAVSLGGVFNLPQWLRQARRNEAPFILAAQRAWLVGEQRLSADALQVPARGIRNPLLLMHARDDDRVAIDQSVEFAEELRDLGIPFEFEWLPSGGHTFGSPEQRAQLWSRVDAFLRRSLGMRAPSTYISP